MEKTSRSISHLDEHDTNVEALVNRVLARKEDRVFEKQLQMQQTPFQACLQSSGEAMNKRFDDMVSVTIVDYC